MKLVETVNLFGAADRLSKLQLDQAPDHGITEDQADQEGCESRAEGPEGDVLKNIEGLGELSPMEKGSELREIVEHRLTGCWLVESLKDLLHAGAPAGFKKDHIPLRSKVGEQLCGGGIVGK